MPQWQQGASYCYEVTTLLGGLESVASNQVITAAPHAREPPVEFGSSWRTDRLDNAASSRAQRELAVPQRPNVGPEIARCLAWHTEKPGDASCEKRCGKLGAPHRDSSASGP